MRRHTSLIQWALFAYCFLASAAPVRAGSALLQRKTATVIKDIPYPGAKKGDRRRSFDLYLPADSGKKPPLLIFIHGGFWLLSDDDYRIGPAAAEALVRDGIAVALLRYRLATAVSHPAQAEDVAAGVALLMREAKRYGYDPDRIFLSGHSAGGHLTALIALDPRYLGAHHASPKSLAGVIAFSGLFNLAPGRAVSEEQKIATEKTFGIKVAALRAASPLAHVRADAPPFLILSAEDDLPGFMLDAKNFADALRRSSHQQVERWIAGNRDHFTLMRLGDRDNEARYLLLEFLKIALPPPEAKILFDAKRRWRDPPFSTLPFWRHEKLVRSFPVDQRFVAHLVPIYDSMRYELLEWPLEKFYAIDLFAFLDSLPAEKVGRGEYLITTNIRDEKQFWKREQVEPYKPVIVIGLDSEQNLFKLGVFYRAKREYSWKGGPQPPMMARPLGAFIYFLKEPPAEIGLQSAQYALTDKSFKLVAEDPLARLKDLPEDIFKTVTFRNGCVYCHEWRGAGSRSHHVTAADGTAHGGFALPLESYPLEVWENFIFDQNNVARKIGASPNPVAEGVRKPLYEWVKASREKNAFAPAR
jgi:arylformamidase